MSAVSKAARREIEEALERAGDAAELGALSDRELLELIRGSPLAERFLAESRAERAERRAELVKRKKQQIEAAAREIPALMKKRDETRASVATREADLETARKTADAAQSDYAQRDVHLRHAVAAIDAELEVLAPREIDLFIARMETALEVARRSLTIELVDRWNNTEAEQAARRARLLERNLRFEGYPIAIRKAAELKQTALDGEGLLAALRSLEANMVELAKAERDGRGEVIP